MGIGDAGAGPTISAEGLAVFYNLQGSLRSYMRSDLTSELAPDDDFQIVAPHPSLSADQYDLFYNCGVKICMRSRPSRTLHGFTPFGDEYELLTDARDPWIGADGRDLVFGSGQALFQMTRTCDL